MGLSPNLCVCVFVFRYYTLRLGLEGGATGGYEGSGGSASIEIME